MAKGINKIIGESFLDIEEILTPEEKLLLAKQWNSTVSKTWPGIDLFLRKNLVECIQPRRLEKESGYRDTRHMLCTRNFWLAKRLAKLRGLKMRVLQPRGTTWYKRRDLVLVWDIVFNDWRMIDLRKPNKWKILDFIPFTTEEQFVQVANLWTTKMKKVRLDSSMARTYCNLIRKGV